MLQGIKAALLRCFGTLSPTVLSQGCPQQPQAWPRLLFVLAFFHALVLERRKYGSLGWNTMYDFSDGDWLCARQTLSMFLNTQVRPTACHFDITALHTQLAELTNRDFTTHHRSCSCWKSPLCIREPNVHAGASSHLVILSVLVSCGTDDNGISTAVLLPSDMVKVEFHMTLNTAFKLDVRIPSTNNTIQYSSHTRSLLSTPADP